MHRQLPEPSTRPDCVPQRSRGRYPSLQALEMLLRTPSELQAACWPSASAHLPCPQNISWKWKTRALCRLHQTLRARPDIFPLDLFPSRSIAKLAPGIQTLLYPYSAPLSQYHALFCVKESSCSIFSFTRALASPAATRMAFLTALAFERPCAMTHTPRTPNKGAPPYSA